MKGIGMGKHRKSGVSGKSPKFRHQAKLDAERNEKKDTSRIKEPKTSVKDLFKG